MTWHYTFMHHDSHGMPRPCQDPACSAKRSTYRLVAENDDGKTGARNLCTNHSAAAASRLGIAFPPVNSPAALSDYNITVLPNKSANSGLRWVPNA